MDDPGGLPCETPCYPEKVLIFHMVAPIKATRGESVDIPGFATSNLVAQQSLSSFQRLGLNVEQACWTGSQLVGRLMILGS